MTARAVAAVVGVAVAVVALPAQVAGAARPATTMFTIADPRIGEASGIAIGRTSPGIVYVQNDSGDEARFFALDARTGATAATVRVRGAAAVDWEDIATAPDSAGTASVWLADIGDNDAARREVRLYRVDEPRVRPGDRGRTLRTAAADVWRLRYPDGPTDAESLAVAPDGTAYLVTKSVFGRSTVFRVPPRPAAGRVQLLQPVGSITFRLTGTPSPFGLPGELSATGATMSADGSLFVVRTYSDAYVWRVTGGDVAAALARTPGVLPLSRQPQGEGIAIAGRNLLLASEGRHSAVLKVPLPASVAPAPVAPGSAARTLSPAVSASGAAAADRPGPPRSARSDGGPDLATVALVAGTGVVVLLVALLFGRGTLARRRRRKGPTREGSEACRSPRSTTPSL